MCYALFISFYIPQFCEVGGIRKHFTADKADERVNN